LKGIYVAFCAEVALGHIAPQASEWYVCLSKDKWYVVGQSGEVWTVKVGKHYGFEKVMEAEH
jgi:hypothetical protein